MMTVQMPGDTQRRDVLTVDRRTFTMWLATIDTGRLKNDAARQMLIAFQTEAADALDAYFNAGGANPATPRLPTTATCGCGAVTQLVKGRATRSCAPRDRRTTNSHPASAGGLQLSGGRKMIDEKWQEMWDAAQTVQRSLYADEIIPRRLYVDEWSVRVTVERDQLGAAAVILFDDAPSLPVTMYAVADGATSSVRGLVDGVDVVITAFRAHAVETSSCTVADFLAGAR